MKLLEYEAKAILRLGGLPVPSSVLISSNTPSDEVFLPIVLKSQVPVGGRGKLGGVVILDTKPELETTIQHLLDLDIKGHLPSVILGEEKLSILNEHYLSLFIDRDVSTIVLMAHKNGGVEVETNQSSDFFRMEINTETIKQCAAELAIYLGYEEKLIFPFLENLYTIFTRNDATLIEINPLVFTNEEKLVCGDCKMELDDAAAFRHPEWNYEDTLGDTNFVTIDPEGTVATIANGAGLAMATVDAVSAKGLAPANFLDIGGGANTASVLQAFERIMKFDKVQAIVVNIFAGITRCDEVAKAIIEARKQIQNLPPLFIRLAGTNFEEAVELLAKENITTLATLEECLAAAKEHIDV
jgi:succinyl-CoA synthetase beta subunit